MKLLLLLSLFGVLALASGEYSAPSARKIKYYKSVLKFVLKQKMHLVPKAVRLGFHDCVGEKCDGCINLDNPANKGLKEIIDVAEECYKNLKVGPVMSRADFWQLVAITATEFGVKKSNQAGNEMPSTLMTVRWGREDCPSSPSTSEVHKFPKSTLSRTAMLEFFSKNYGLNADEVVAIMGAHTLGGAKVENSGYRGNWTKDPIQFNPEYYMNLITYHHTKINVAIDKDDSNGDGNKKWQWDVTNGVMLLNTDVHLAYDINVHPFHGTTNCNFDRSGSNFCKSVPTIGLVENFAYDGARFWDAYRAAYDKLSLFGYNNLKVVNLE